jgi:hypothetical protein
MAQAKLRIQYKPARDQMMAALPSYLDHFEDMMRQLEGFEPHHRKELKDGWHSVLSWGALDNAAQHSVTFNWDALFARRPYSKECPCLNVFWLHRSLMAGHWNAPLMSEGFGLDMGAAQFDAEPRDPEFLRRRWISDTNLPLTAGILAGLRVPLKPAPVDF